MQSPQFLDGRLYEVYLSRVVSPEEIERALSLFCPHHGNYSTTRGTEQTVFCAEFPLRITILSSTVAYRDDLQVKLARQMAEHFQCRTLCNAPSYRVDQTNPDQMVLCDGEQTYVVDTYESEFQPPKGKAVKVIQQIDTPSC